MPRRVDNIKPENEPFSGSIDELKVNRIEPLDGTEVEFISQSIAFDSGGHISSGGIYNGSTIETENIRSRTVSSDIVLEPASGRVVRLSASSGGSTILRCNGIQPFADNNNLFLNATGSGLISFGAYNIRFPIAVGSGGTSSDFRHYETLTQNTTCSGIWASSQSMTLRITRIGNLVTVTNETRVNATQNTASFITIAYTLPERFRPSASNGLYFPILVNDGSPNSVGYFVVGSTGVMTIQDGVTYGNFSGSGNGGFWGFSVNYIV